MEAVRTLTFGCGQHVCTVYVDADFNIFYDAGVSRYVSDDVPAITLGQGCLSLKGTQILVIPEQLVYDNINYYGRSVFLEPARAAVKIIKRSALAALVTFDAMRAALVASWQELAAHKAALLQSQCEINVVRAELVAQKSELAQSRRHLCKLISQWVTANPPSSKWAQSSTALPTIFEDYYDEYMKTNPAIPSDIFKDGIRAAGFRLAVVEETGDRSTTLII